MNSISTSVLDVLQRLGIEYIRRDERNNYYKEKQKWKC